MTRTLDTAFLTLVLLSLGSPALGQISESTATVTTEEATGGTVTLRFAAVYGAVEAGAEIPEDLRDLQIELQSAMDDWDLSADFSELKRVFQLAELSEIARWSSTVSRPKGEIATRLSERWRLELIYSFDDPSIVEVRVKLFEDGELVSAPRLESQLGERMIFSTAHPDGTFFFMFMEIDE